MNEDSGKVVIAIVFFVVLAALAAFTGCTEPNKATRLLTEQGYTHIEMTGLRFWTCGDDWYATGFRAERDGHKISGTVCDGLLMKNATIRFD